MTAEYFIPKIKELIVINSLVKLKWSIIITEHNPI